MTENWDVHAHKDELHISAHNTIYHREHGQLCTFEKVQGDFKEYLLLAHPISFKDTATAYKWIREGCIADLQTGCGTLHVGFFTECAKWVTR